MKRNIGSVLIVIVGVILAVDVVARLAPQEAVAQEDAAAIAKAIKQHALQRKEDAPAIAKAIRQHALQRKEDAPAIAKAIKQHALQRKEDAAAIAKAIKQQALQQQRLIYEAAAARTAMPTRTTTPSIFTRVAWATDLEIVGNSYYILWSDGSVTNGGTLP